MIVGYRCAACGATVDIATAWPWRCPKGTSSDRAHVLRIITSGSPPPVADDDPNPLVAYRARTAWHAFARVHGIDDAACVAMARHLDDAVAAIDGVGFRRTPFGSSPGLSDAVAIDVWVKDETRNVAGSHKARHLVGILLHLLVAERAGIAAPATRRRPRLAIASCGNAALAAATLARAMEWPLDVFVPTSADPLVLAHLDGLGAHVIICPRRDDDPPGDPCMHRFRAAVDGDAVPFTVQGPENGLCLDTGRTIAWEMADALAGTTLDDVFVQVGGGALATVVGDGLRETGVSARVRTVQTDGCAPLARAWARLSDGPVDVERAAAHWHDYMWPWESVPSSAATGILDDETYDWVGVVEAMSASGGSAVVVTEDGVAAAEALTRRATDVAVDATGTAGLAGLLAIRDDLSDAARVAVLFTGRRRSSR